ncbi:hypothetical protein H6P87_01164 [Rickettsia tillamookensis]|uniref:Uncharacterized protein n=1 Tax=Rickettsia tillamookensis TaxID=2761623 RepID=A0A9E6MIL8_9RICK|nr:hypothetical protein [Rickettsia tillamookensis]QQV75601.1 hypothetical protein H6P87_01164 [Rickettsia tillamookensis]
MKEQKLFINDMNYINQHYTIKIFGFVPNSSFQKKTEPFCIFNNESFGLSYVPITETLQFRLTRNFFVKLDLEPINARENINILNALSCDAQNQWYAAKDGEEVSVHYATLQEIKGLRDLVENDKVKLSSHDKTETLELIAQYEQTYADLIKLMGEEDDII